MVTLVLVVIVLVKDVNWLLLSNELGAMPSMFTMRAID